MNVLIISASLLRAEKMRRSLGVSDEVMYSTVPRRRKAKTFVKDGQDDRDPDDQVPDDFKVHLSKSLDDLSLTDKWFSEEQGQFTSKVKSNQKATVQEIEDLKQDLTDTATKMPPQTAAFFLYPLNARTPLQEAFRNGKRKFNSESTSEGVYFFIDKALINDTPEDVAMCLYMEGFNKVAIGKYFGKRYTDPLHHKVLERYLQFVNVSGLGLVEAIREFAKVVTLPSDPGSVEHIMTEFGKHYHQSNPSKFDCADTCSACAVSVALLSNNLHELKYHKVSFEDYQDMHAEFSAELSQDTLRGFYDAVDREPIQVRIRLRQKTVEHEGLVDIEDKPNKWKKGYDCKLFSEGCLQFSRPQHEKKKGPKIISLAGLNVRDIQPLSPKKNQFIFELHPIDPDVKGVKIARPSSTREPVVMPNGVRLRVKSHEEKEMWMKKISQQLKKIERKGHESFRLSYSREQGDIH